jgi:uncharacterized membrane protein YfcA
LFKGTGWAQVVRAYWPMALCSVVGTVISTHWLITGDSEPFRLLLAIIVLLYLAVSQWRGMQLRWVSRRPLTAKITFGLVAGLSAGATNVMVPFLIIYALESRLAASAMVQVFNFCFLSGKATQIVFLSSAGIADNSVWIQNLPLAGLAVLILLSGMKIRARLATNTYQRIVRWVLGLLATLLIAQFTYFKLW